MRRRGYGESLWDVGARAIQWFVWIKLCCSFQILEASCKGTYWGLLVQNYGSSQVIIRLIHWELWVYLWLIKQLRVMQSISILSIISRSITPHFITWRPTSIYQQTDLLCWLNISECIVMNDSSTHSLCILNYIRQIIDDTVLLPYRDSVNTHYLL